MNRRFLENFRLKRLYSPSVIERIFAVYRDDYHGQAYNPWDDSDEDRQEIESLLPWLNETARQQREAWDAEMAAVHDACGHALCAAPDKDVPETAVDAEVDRVLGKAHGEFGPSASDSGWVPCDGGKTLGTRGSENGLILIDEEHPEGARITLEQCDRHCAVTCGILGGMVHTSFCDKDRASGTRATSRCGRTSRTLSRATSRMTRCSPSSTGSATSGSDATGFKGRSRSERRRTRAPMGAQVADPSVGALEHTQGF